MQSIIRNLQNTLNGEPWYGKPILALLQGADPAQVNVKPNANSHTLNELLYHMIYWAEFTLNCVHGIRPPVDYDDLDWPAIDPVEQTWQKGLSRFKTIHGQLTDQLQTKDDTLLKEMVEGTRYNFRFMLNGLIQHNIYHVAQIAYITKLLDT